MRKISQNQSKPPGISDELKREISLAGELSWSIFGRRVKFFLPGIFTVYGETGKYPAVSVTGAKCDLLCAHCRGKLLKGMITARNADELLTLAHKWKAEGILGILLSGGSTKDGFVPLQSILPAVPILKKMGFFISAHTGFAGKKLVRAVADAGVDQVLVDIVGDDETARKVLNLQNGLRQIISSLDALFSEKIDIVPHIIIGLGGKISSEYNAFQMLKSYPMKLLCHVVLMPAVAMRQRELPPLDEVVSFICSARMEFPNLEQSLGCARPRGKYRRELEKLAIRAGINRMALWSDEALCEAENLGLEISFKYTCCSVG